MVKRRTTASKSKNGKRKKKTTKKQKGGVGTSFFDLPSDIGALAVSIVNTMVDSAKLMISAFEVPADLGVAFADPGAPGVNNP